MHKSSVAVKVHHTAKYQAPAQTDHWKWQGTGELIRLRQTTRLNYTNQEGQDYQIRWSHAEDETDEAMEITLVEVIQPHLKLRFNLEETTYSQIKTPHGYLPVAVKTQSIDWRVIDTRRELKMTYQLLTDDQVLGSYAYHLIFDQEKSDNF